MSRGTISLGEALAISRPLRWVVTALPFAVGGFAASSEPSLLLVVGTLYFMFPYNLLLYGVGDIFDYEEDLRSKYRETLSRLKHPALWRWILAVNVPFWLFFAAAGNTESLAFLFMIVYLTFAYSAKGLRYKELPFIDALTSAFLYTAPFLLGLFLFSSPTLLVSAYAAFYFWAVGTHAFSTVQDIGQDRSGGVKSIATYLGASKTLVFTLGAYGLAILALVLGYGLSGLLGSVAILPYFLTVASVYRYRGNDGSPRFKAAWNKFLPLNYLVGVCGSAILLYLYNN